MLGAGVLYGFSHNSTLANKAHAEHVEALYNKKVKLIDEAKAEWARQHPAKETASTGKVDLEDPNFDLVKYIEQSVDQLKA